MKTLIIIASAIVISGCASTDYALYAETQKHIAASKSAAEVARYQALADIARQGDATAKVAAVITLNQSQQQSSSQQIAAPITFGEQFLRWAGILVPAITQTYAISKNADVAINNSNNNAAVAQSTNQTFSAIASQIQAPGSTTTNTYTDSYNQTDSTHTPTVVTQPAPVIVQPTDPIVVTQPAPIIVTP